MTATESVDPIVRFDDWMRRATTVGRDIIPEPTAFALATASGDGRPSVRMLLLKEVTARGFVFYTNMGSRKGRELLETRAAAMCFHWAPLELQVRVEGNVEPVRDAEADVYFGSRPRESQLGAWASLQSEVLDDRAELERRYNEYEQKYSGAPVPRPPYWSGVLLKPTVIEFWEGMPNRLHIRRQYLHTAEGWTSRGLYP